MSLSLSLRVRMCMCMCVSDYHYACERLISVCVRLCVCVNVCECVNVCLCVSVCVCVCVCVFGIWFVTSLNISALDTWLEGCLSSSSAISPHTSLTHVSQ